MFSRLNPACSSGPTCVSCGTGGQRGAAVPWGASCEKGGHGTAPAARGKTLRAPLWRSLPISSTTGESHSHGGFWLIPGAALGRGTAHLKHLLDVAVAGFEQLSPRGQVAVGEDPSGPQQAEGVALPRESGEPAQLLPLSPRAQLPLPAPEPLPEVSPG